MGVDSIMIKMFQQKLRANYNKSLVNCNCNYICFRFLMLHSLENDYDNTKINYYYWDVSINRISNSIPIQLKRS